MWTHGGSFATLLTGLQLVCDVVDRNRPLTRQQRRNGSCKPSTTSQSGSQAPRLQPQQSGGQVRHDLVRTAADTEDPGVAVVPLHLTTRVAHPSEQLHCTVGDEGRAVHAGLLGVDGVEDRDLPTFGEPVDV